MSISTTGVAAALAAVTEDAFVRQPDGSLVTQSTSAPAIARTLNRLDTRPGMRVLEIGTGSGYSTALLAELVVPAGHVVSVDVVPGLVVRAAKLLAERWAEHTTLVHGDGRAGVPELAPFDRLVAWTTAPLLPGTWVDQVRPGGKIVAPVSLTPLSKTGAGVVVEVDAVGAPTAKALFAARYVEMHAQPVTQWLVPPYGADVVRPDPDGRTWWLSAEHFRRPADRPIGAALLDRLAEYPVRGTGPLVGGEQATAFAAWLGAVRPSGLTTAALGDPCWRIGLTGPDGAALLATLGGPDLVTAGGDGPARKLAALVDRWRQDGRPDIADLAPRLEGAPGGWKVRAAVPPIGPLALD